MEYRWKRHTDAPRSMYIVVSILFFAFVEVVSMLLFRAWEIKRGRIDVDARAASYERDHIDRRQGRAMHHLMRLLFDKGKRVTQWTIREFYRAKTKFGAKTGITRMRNLVEGRGEFDSERGSASGYLQDITDHRDSVREEASK